MQCSKNINLEHAPNNRQSAKLFGVCMRAEKLFLLVTQKSIYDDIQAHNTHSYAYIHTSSHMYTYAHIHTHIGIYVLTKHTLTYIGTQLSLYIYNYLIIILLSNDSSKLPFVFYGYILKTAVAQVHTAPVQTQRGWVQVGMASLTPACVKSQNQRLAELSLSHHPAHSVC